MSADSEWVDDEASWVDDPTPMRVLPKAAPTPDGIMDIDVPEKDDPRQIGPIGGALLGAGQGASVKWGDELQGGASALGSGSSVSDAIAPTKQTFTKSLATPSGMREVSRQTTTTQGADSMPPPDFFERYRAERDKARGVNKLAHDQNSKVYNTFETGASMLPQAAAAILTRGKSLTPGGQAIFGGASALGGSDDDLSTLKGAGMAAGKTALGAGAAYGSTKLFNAAAPYVSKYVSQPIGNKLDEVLQSISRNRTISALGPMLKGMRALDHKGTANELADALLENEAIPFGAKPEGIRDRALPMMRDVGEKIGAKRASAENVAEMLPEMTGSPHMTMGPEGVPVSKPGVNPHELARDIRERLVKPDARLSPALRKGADTINAEAEHIGHEMGNRWSFGETADMKKKYGDVLDWDKEQSVQPEKLKELYRIINQHDEAAIGDALGPKELADYVGKKRLYGHLATASDIAGDKALRDNANRIISPSDYGVGAAVGAGKIASGEATPEAAVHATAMSFLHKLARERGSSATAVTAHALRGLPEWARGTVGGKLAGDLATPAAAQYVAGKASTASTLKALLEMLGRKDTEQTR